MPVSIVGKAGIYTIYIRPTEINATLYDVGALASYPDVRGIVLNMNSITEYRALFDSDNLTGYRIEYLSTDGNGNRQDYYRLVTSSNLCEPISQNFTSANTNANDYRYNENDSITFITLTPSPSPSCKPNATPLIGSPRQDIIITNTKFDPVCLEIEMTRQDIERLGT